MARRYAGVAAVILLPNIDPQVYDARPLLKDIRTKSHDRCARAGLSIGFPHRAGAHARHSAAAAAARTSRVRVFRGLPSEEHEPQQYRRCRSTNGGSPEYTRRLPGLGVTDVAVCQPTMSLTSVRS